MLVPVEAPFDNVPVALYQCMQHGWPRFHGLTLTYCSGYQNSLIEGNEYADTMAKKGAKITQTHIRVTSYHSIKLHLKQVFRSACRQELGTKLSQKPWTQELAKIPDWPRRKAVAEFRLCVGHDCLGTLLHLIGIRPVPNSMLCSLHETIDRNHLGRCTALSNGTECERYWGARKKNDGKLTSSLLYYYFCDYSLL